MEINSSSSSMNQYYPSRAKTNEKVAYGIGQANQEDVTLSDRAKYLQMKEQNQQDDLTLLDGSEEEREKAPSDDAIRVSTTIGRHAAAGNYTREEAMEIYRSIQQLL